MIIKDLFPDYGRASCNTGNLYITGLANMGADGCFQELINNLYTENNPIFYFDNHLSREKKQHMVNMATANGYRIFDINNIASHCVSFDVFSSYETNEEKANAIYSFLSSKEDSLDFINQLCRYFQDAILSLHGKRKRISFREILSLSIEEIKDGIRLFRELEDTEIEEEILFLESRETYRIWGVVNDRARKLRTCGLIDVLSGVNTANDIFNGKTLVMISQNIGTGDSARNYLSFSNGFISLLGKIGEERNESNKPYHIFIKNCTDLKREQMEMILNVTMDAPFAIPLCIYDQSVTKTIDIHSLYVLDYFGAFAVFKTNDGSFWSDFLGTALTPDRTETFSRRRSPILVTTGGVVPRRTSKYEGTTVHRIEKPLYEARVFSALKDKCLIFYNVYSNRKSRKQLRW